MHFALVLVTSVSVTGFAKSDLIVTETHFQFCLNVIATLKYYQYPDTVTI